jgi:hypothetical protein
MSGQHVLEEAADKDAGIEAHDLRGVAVGVVFVSEGDGVVVDVDDAVVADCDLVGLAGEVRQHLLRTTEWRFGVDGPFHGGGVVEATLKVVVGDGLEPTMTEFVEHLAAKDLRYGADGEEKPSLRRDPCLIFDVECTAGHDEVDMGMVGEGLPPGVQDGEESELPLEAVAPELEQRLRSGAKEGLVEAGARDDRDVDECRGQGKDNVEIGDRDKVLLLLRIGGTGRILRITPCCRPW